MPYRLDIPGQVSEEQLLAIEAVAATVPRGGIVVEVGSLFGRSSWAWAKSVPKGAEVFCIDPWQDNPGVRTMEAEFGIVYGLEQFKAYTNDCPNIHAIQAYSPQGVLWERAIDVYYEDAVHINPILTENVNFWTKWLRADGIACGDDFRPRFPDVVRAARELAETTGGDLHVVDFFWCVIPASAKERPKFKKLAKTLKALADRFESLQVYGSAVSLVPLNEVPAEAEAGGSLCIDLRIVNDGQHPWIGPDEKLVVQGTLTDAEGVVALEHKVPVFEGHLKYDIPIDLQLRLDLNDIAPGLYHLGVTLEGLDAAIGKAFESSILINQVNGRAPSSRRYRFKAGDESCPTLSDGWSSPEGNYTWMVGGSSSVTLECPTSEQDEVWLGIRLHPFASAGTRRDLEIQVDGVRLASANLSLSGELKLKMPARKRTAIRIDLIHSNTSKPSNQTVGNQDHRDLSFAVEYVDIDFSE